MKLYELQDKNCSTETITLMANRAFDVGYRRLEWFCNKEDSELVSTAKEIGLKYEGVFRNYGVVKGTKIGQTVKSTEVLLVILTR